MPHSWGEPEYVHSLGARPDGGPRLRRGAGGCHRCNVLVFEACVREVLFRGPASPDRRRAAGWNDRHPDRGGPGPFAAHPMALERMPRHKQPRLTMDVAMRDVMQGWHDLRWSPEQISHWLRIQHPQILVFHMEFPRLQDPAVPPPGPASGPGFTPRTTHPKTVDRPLNQRGVRPHRPAHRLSHRK